VKVGVPKEVKNHEYRVAITPIGVHELTSHGHEVYIQKDAGVGSSIEDSEYVAAGATIVPTAEAAWGTDGDIDMVLKVKEPVAEEYSRMREGLTLLRDPALTGTVLVTLPEAGPAHVALYDVLGRRVRVLRDETLPKGSTIAAWDGRDDAGNSVRRGVYFARVTTPHGRAHARFLVLE